MKKYLLFLFLFITIAFAFNIGVALQKNVEHVVIFADSSIIVSNNNRTLSFAPLETLQCQSYRDHILINGKAWALPLNINSKLGLISVNDIKYRDKIRIIVGKKGFTIVNSLDSEGYISDVMMNFPQNLALQTYKAIAVTLRSFLYALKRLYSKDDYFITTNNKYFPYEGYKTPSKNILYAVQSTKNEVLFYKGNPVYAYYTYDCGGITASAKEIFGYNVGYLKAVPSPFGSDDSKYSQWSHYYTMLKLTSIFSHFISGKIYALYILSRTESGRVKTLYIKTTAGKYYVRGIDIYKWVPRDILPSLMFNVSKYKDGYNFVGKGYGSGLGLPIYDANAFAQRGYSYSDILSHFYPSTVLKTLK